MKDLENISQSKFKDDFEEDINLLSCNDTEEQNIIKKDDLDDRIDDDIDDYSLDDNGYY